MPCTANAYLYGLRTTVPVYEQKRNEIALRIVQILDNEFSRHMVEHVGGVQAARWRLSLDSQQRH